MAAKPDTTKSGTDYWIYLKASTNTAGLYQVSGGPDANGNYNGISVANAVLSSTLGFNTWGVVVNTAKFGNPTSFGFWVKATDGNQTQDVTPNQGTYTYPASPTS